MIESLEINVRVLPFLSAFFVILFTTHAVPEEDVISWKRDVKGWDILVDRTIGNGCFMTTIYDGDTYLRIQFNPESNDFEFIIGNPNWKSLERGKIYPMSVQFGNLSPWTGDGNGFFFGENSPALIISVSFQDDKASNFIGEFMKMTSVKVKYNGKQIAHLSLRGTYAAMEEVFKCQAAMLDTPSNNDPFSSSGQKKIDPFE